MAPFPIFCWYFVPSQSRQIFGFPVELFPICGEIYVYIFILKMECGNENIIKILDFYERESVICNTSHRDHKNRNLVYDAWKREREKYGLNIFCRRVKEERKKVL